MSKQESPTFTFGRDDKRKIYMLLKANGLPETAKVLLEKYLMHVIGRIKEPDVIFSGGDVFVPIQRIENIDKIEDNHEIDGDFFKKFDALKIEMRAIVKDEPFEEIRLEAGTWLCQGHLIALLDPNEGESSADESLLAVLQSFFQSSAAMNSLESPQISVSSADRDDEASQWVYPTPKILDWIKIIASEGRADLIGEDFFSQTHRLLPSSWLSWLIWLRAREISKEASTSIEADVLSPEAIELPEENVESETPEKPMEDVDAPDSVEHIPPPSDESTNPVPDVEEKQPELDSSEHVLIALHLDSAFRTELCPFPEEHSKEAWERWRKEQDQVDWGRIEEPVTSTVDQYPPPTISIPVITPQEPITTQATSYRWLWIVFILMIMLAVVYVQMDKKRAPDSSLRKAAPRLLTKKREFLPPKSTKLFELSKPKTLLKPTDHARLRTLASLFCGPKLAKKPLLDYMQPLQLWHQQLCKQRSWLFSDLPKLWTAALPKKSLILVQRLHEKLRQKGQTFIFGAIQCPCGEPIPARTGGAQLRWMFSCIGGRFAPNDADVDYFLTEMTRRVKPAKDLELIIQDLLAALRSRKERLVSSILRNQNSLKDLRSKNSKYAILAAQSLDKVVEEDQAQLHRLQRVMPKLRYFVELSKASLGLSHEYLV